MKRVLLTLCAGSILMLTSCSNKISSLSKNSVAFPGMTVSRSDYKLSKDVSAEVEVKEWSTLLGRIRGAKTVGENKHELRQGVILGYGLNKAEQIAFYKLLDANPSFDYVTNVRVSKEFTKKWLLFYTKYNSKIKISAKGITLNTEK